MSLDVYLTTPGVKHVRRSTRVCARVDGRTRDLTPEECAARWPDALPVEEQVWESEEIYHGNVTHNLGKMAKAAGLYEALWKPDEIGITTAWQLVPLLELGLAQLRAEPDRYRLFNPHNGWGNYEQLVAFTEEYLSACREWPDAVVEAWR